MKNTKTTLSNAASYGELGEFWDAHGLDGVWEQTHEIVILVEIPTEATLILSPHLEREAA